MPRGAITISPIDVYEPYTRDLKALVSAYSMLERAERAGGAGGAKALKVTGYGYVTDPVTGEQKQVPLHGTKDERKAELDKMQLDAVNQTLSSNIPTRALSDISQMSVEKGEKTLQELQTNMVNQLSKNAPSLRSTFSQSVQQAFAPAREEINQRKKAIKEASSLDVIGSAASGAWNYLQQMITSDKQEGIRLARERAAQEAADRQQNAYLENQYRRAREGAGVWERGAGTGSRTLNTLAGAIEMAPALGVTLGAGAIGSFAGPLGTAAGAGAAGALTGTADLYNRLVAEHPEWTDQQILNAIDQGALTARATGALTNAILLPAGKALPAIRGFVRGGGEGVSRFAAGKAAAQAAEERLAALPRGARFARNVPAAYAEIAPMAVGYQMGQNWAYNQAVGQDTTLSNLMQGTGEVALSTIPFAGVVAGARSVKAPVRPKSEGGTETPATPTTETDPLAIMRNRETAPEQVKPEAQASSATIDPDVRTTNIDALLNMLSRETDTTEMRRHIMSLQDLKMSVADIKNRISGMENVPNEVRAVVDAVADSHSALPSAGGTPARKQVTALLKSITDLFGKDEKGRIRSYDSDTVAKTVELLDSLPNNITHEYVNAVLGEVAKSKGRNNIFSTHWTGKKYLQFDTESSKVFSDFLRDVRQMRAQNAIDRVTKAQQLRAAADAVNQQAEGVPSAEQATTEPAAVVTRENVVTDGQQGAGTANLPDSSVNSELGAYPETAPTTSPDVGVKDTLASNTETQGGGTGGAAKPDDSAAAQAQAASQAGQPLPEQGTNGGAGAKQTADRLAEQGESTGGNAAQAGGRQGDGGNAASVGKQEPASGVAAKQPIKLNLPAPDAESIRILARDASYSKIGSEKRQTFADMVDSMEPAEAIVALQKAVDSIGDTDKRTSNYIQKALDKLEEDHPALRAGMNNAVNEVSSRRTTKGTDSICGK